MKIRIRNAADFIKYYEFEIELDIKNSFRNIIPIITEKLSTKENLKFILIKSDRHFEIQNHEKSLEEYNYLNSDIIQIEKNKTITIKHTHGIFLGYIGPILISLYFLFIFKGLHNSHWFQILCTVLIILHYSKRIYEVYFVHINAIDMIALDKDYFGFFFYYWVMFGVLICYELFTHDYQKEKFKFWKCFIFLLFQLISEMNNFKSHLILRDIKLKNKGLRAIPYGATFNYVSSAHYFWELCTWVSFSLLSNLKFAYLFAFFSFASMGVLANKKHQSYLEYFKDKYPRNRKAFIPFLF